MRCVAGRPFATDFQGPQSLRWQVGESGPPQGSSAALIGRVDIAPGKRA
jgi:hypothetical protein